VARVAIVCLAILGVLSACATPAATRGEPPAAKAPSPTAGPASRSPEELAGMVEQAVPERATTAPSDPLLAILARYSADSYQLIVRTDGVPSTIAIGGQTVLSEGASESRTTSADGKVETRTLAGTGFRKWIYETDPLKQAGQLSTAVHETSHGYTSKWPVYQLSKRLSSIDEMMVWTADGRAGSAIRLQAHYMDKDRTLVVVPGPMFPSREIASRVPASLRTHRFSEYIDGGASHATQVEGIYGLLNEFTAYYCDRRLSYDLYDYYRLELPQTAETWLDYLSGASGTYPAWAEFRYFILTYLLHARETRPDIYRQILADRRLREAFTQNDDAFMSLLRDYNRRVAVELPTHLKSIGVSAEIRPSGDDYRFWIRTGSSSRGVGMFLADHRHLHAVLSTSLYKELADTLRVRPSPDLPPADFQ
jgi:hypothetical protein